LLVSLVALEIALGPACRYFSLAGMSTSGSFPPASFARRFASDLVEC
jgi:hypothetical protein